MKTRTEIIDEAVQYWLQHEADKYLDTEDCHLMDFDVEMIQEDLSHEDIGYRECWHLLQAVTDRINDTEWAEFLYLTDED